MTDTLQAAPDVALFADEETLGCGCCIRPPAEADEKIAVLEARRERLDRRLRGLDTGTV